MLLCSNCGSGSSSSDSRRRNSRRFVKAVVVNKEVNNVAIN